MVVGGWWDGKRYRGTCYILNRCAGYFGGYWSLRPMSHENVSRLDVCFPILLTYSIFFNNTSHSTPHLSLLTSHLVFNPPIPQSLFLAAPGDATTIAETCSALHICTITASLSVPICSHADHPETKACPELYTTALPVPTTTALCRRKEKHS